MPNHKSLPRKIHPYPLRLPIKPDESLFGYIHRFASHNGLPRTRWLLQDIEIPLRSIFLSGGQVNGLATMCGLDPQVLHAHQMSGTAARTVQFHGEPVRLALVERKLSRLCLSCVRDDPYHRLIWDLRPVTHCPIHAEPLVEYCPTCGKPLRWHRSRLLLCEDGHDIRQSTIVDDHAFGLVLDGIRAIYELCGNAHGARPVLAGIAPEVGALSLGNFLDLLSWFREFRHRLSPSSVSGDRRDTGTQLVQGFEMIPGWPQPLYVALDRQIRPGKSLLGRPLTFWINKSVSRLGPGAANLLKTTLAQYAESKGRANVFWTARPKDGDSLTLAEAHRMLRTSVGRVKQLAHEHGWFADRTLLPAQGGRLSRQKVEAWMRTRQPRVTLTDASKQLGTQSSTMIDLIRGGAFGPAAVRRAEIAGDRFLFADELKVFQAKLTSSLEKQRSDVEIVSWMGFIRRSDGGQLPLATLITAVVSGRLRPAGWNKKRMLGTLRFRLVDLKDLFRRVSTTFDGEEMLGLQAASRHFDLHPSYLAFAANRGILRAKLGNHSNRLVSLRDVEDFLRVYTCPEILAKKYRKDPRKIGGLLTRLKVPAVNRGARVRLFRISDVEASDFAAFVKDLRSPSGRNKSNRKSR